MQAPKALMANIVLSRKSNTVPIPNISSYIPTKSALHVL